MEIFAVFLPYKSYVLMIVLYSTQCISSIPGGIMGAGHCPWGGYSDRNVCNIDEEVPNMEALGQMVLPFLGPCTPQNRILDIDKKQGILLI